MLLAAVMVAGCGANYLDLRNPTDASFIVEGAGNGQEVWYAVPRRSKGVLWAAGEGVPTLLGVTVYSPECTRLDSVTHVPEQGGLITLDADGHPTFESFHGRFESRLFGVSRFEATDPCVRGSPRSSPRVSGSAAP